MNEEQRQLMRREEAGAARVSGWRDWGGITVMYKLQRASPRPGGPGAFLWRPRGFRLKV